jgi:hypothetical protein
LHIAVRNRLLLLRGRCEGISGGDWRERKGFGMFVYLVCWTVCVRIVLNFSVTTMRTGAALQIPHGKPGYLQVKSDSQVVLLLEMLLVVCFALVLLA